MNANLAQITNETEDGVPFDIKDSIKIDMVKPSGEKVSIDTIYPKQSVKEGIVKYKAKSSKNDFTYCINSKALDFLS